MSKKNIQISSRKSFGIVFSIVFLIIAIYPLISNENIRYWSLFLSLVFLLLGIRNSIVLTPLNYIWFKFGIYLGNFIAPIVMGLVYFFVAYPTNLFLKIFKKNYLGIKKDKKIDSYWINVKGSKSNMKDQF